MDQLAQLVSEVKSSSASYQEAPTEADCKSGHLVITGAIDWDAGAAKVAGLDEPHIVHLSAGSNTVVKTFSSSSSAHSFILLSSGRLLALGKNDCGESIKLACAHSS
jgi:hypothetical protein